MQRYLKTGLPGTLVAFCILVQTALAATPAGIKILAVSPRLRDEATSDIYDVKSSGLDVVGINQRVYLVPEPDPAYATSISTCVWSFVSQPASGAAVVDLNTSSVLKFHPSLAGAYVIQMVPYVSGVASTPTTQRIFAAKYVGTGTEGTNTPTYPRCGMGCHASQITGWQTTNHAHKLQNHLNHVYGTFYSTSCLECHTLGYDTVASGNDNFYQIAQGLPFDLNQIATWVADTTTSHWNDLPAPLQLKSNIQCESCHGPGNSHGGDVTKIAAGQYSGDACRQCHDSGSGHQQKVWQWDRSSHSLPAEAHMATNPSCQKCHTAEGFVAITVDGGTAIPSNITTRNNVTCVACHDPHSASNPHELRKITAVTLPNGAVYDGGLGNQCANCHNSRISNPTTTINASSRGAHHSPVADILLGTSAYNWGVRYPAGASVHLSATTDTCVSCHMATAPPGASPAPMGGHTFAIDAGTTQNVQNACGGCHAGIRSTDRVPMHGQDYDGDGYASGIQTEVGHLLANVRDKLLLLPGTTWNAATPKIDIASSSYSTLTFNQKAALYNFNLCSEEKSRGVHNADYVIAVLQRSYQYADPTSHTYAQDYPLARVLDQPQIVVIGGPLDFGSRDIDAGPTPSQTVIIRNDGTAPLIFTSAGISLVGTNAAEFAITNSPATTPLAPGTSRTIQVAFDPSSVGSKTASLQIETNDAGYPVATVALAGNSLDSPSAIPAGINILAVSPRLRDQSTSDSYDVKSSGLDIVGINQRVYLTPTPDATYATSLTNCVWSILREPSPGAAVIDSNTSGVLKFHPSAGGEYLVGMVPYVSGVASTPTKQRIYAAQFVGTGMEGSNTHLPPRCGAGCHTDKINGWLTTQHAHKLENHLNHKFGAFYSVSCLECHTLGYDTLSTGNNNFYEVAQLTSFSLAQIPTWVADTTTSHWPDLPAPLQLKSNIQCESCHGAGSDHSGDTEEISAGLYSAAQCRQCHDSGSGHQQKVWQWDNSKHSHSVRTTSSNCLKCHTAEGFVAITVDGGASIPSGITSRSGMSCVACHDPHSAANPHELRKITAVTLPIGAVYDGGFGNQCANCHNSRISNPTTTINTSSRGAHYSPVADILLGKTAYDWGVRYPATVSPHMTVTSNTCVTCHMAPAPAGAAPAPVGDHTFAIDAGTTSNVQRACATCHAGLTTLDRIPPDAHDYDGDGYTSGIQTEVGRLLANVRGKLLLLPGTTWNAETQKVDIASSSYTTLTFNQKAALYNFNLCAREGSLGVHNAKYVIAVLQRSYQYAAAGHTYAQDYPAATILDQPLVGVSGGPLNFGSRDAAAGPSAALSVTIQNTGTGLLIFTGAGIALVGPNANQFVFPVAPVTTHLAPGTSRTVSVAFDPSSAGAKTASLQITTNDTLNPTITVALSGTGLDRAITVTPTSYAYGDRDIDNGPALTRVVTIRNTGTAPLNFTGAGIALAGAHASQFLITNNPPKTPLGPGGSRTVNVTFDPNTTGTKTASLRITSDDTLRGTVDVALSGRGIDQTITVSPTAVAFGSRDIHIGPSAVRTVTIRNIGTGPLSFTGAGITLVGTNANQFRITNNPATTVLGPGASRTVNIVFDPFAPGPKTATLRITSDDTERRTMNVPLTGTGVAVVLGVRRGWTLYE